MINMQPQIQRISSEMDGYLHVGTKT